MKNASSITGWREFFSYQFGRGIRWGYGPRNGSVRMGKFSVAGESEVFFDGKLVLVVFAIGNFVVKKSLLVKNGYYLF